MTRWPVLAAIGLASLALGAGVAVLGPFSGDSVADEPTASATANDSAPHDANHTDTGTMTVTAREATYEGVEPSAPPFYASRLVIVKGEISLDELDVRLDNPNGPVEVEASDDGYALVANLTGYGSTPDQAREQRDGMEFHWDAGPPGDRRLIGEVRYEDGSRSTPEDGRQQAHLTLQVPRDVLVDLTTSSTNGPVEAREIHASQLRLNSTNGHVDVHGVQAEVLQADTVNGAIQGVVEGTGSVSLESSSGEIDVDVVPARTGRIDAATSNGDVEVSVPETADRGYEVTASTSNGEATIGLEDGTKRSDGDQARFRTDGFGSREVRTLVTATSSNGDVHVGPR